MDERRVLAVVCVVAILAIVGAIIGLAVHYARRPSAPAPHRSVSAYGQTLLNFTPLSVVMSPMEVNGCSCSPGAMSAMMQLAS